MFEVQTYTLCDGWVNCWTTIGAKGNESPEYYKTEKEALTAIREHVKDWNEDCEDPEYNIDESEFRVHPVGKD
jgi:hypothetical protein